MNWRDKLREHGLGWMLRDFWYRMDWRKPNKDSVKKLLKAEYQVFYLKAYKLPNYKNRSRDKRIIAILRWMTDKENIKYMQDFARWSVTEKWQSVFDTLRLKSGDCEDGAILIFAWARYIGIPSSHIKLWCGKVKTPTSTGGHACIEYKSDVDGKWYKIDWCFYPDTAYIKDRKIKKDLYLETWFEVTDY
jgi:hypothetical protein